MTAVSEKPKSNGAAKSNGSISESISNGTPEPEEVKKVVKETASDVKENASEVKDKAESKAAELGKVVESKASDLGKAVESKVSELPSLADATQQVKDKVSEVAATVPETPSPASTKPVAIKQEKASTGRSSSPPASSFSPSLPSSLPAPSAKQLPANRKRKQPQDFTPSGPGTPTTAPTSPGRTGVKFEDGLAPGEGPEGERTIPVKKNQNVIERTVWTFIMIFGFIGLLCAGHPYMILLVMLCQALVYKEVTALFNLRDRESF
jgi:phosphatidate cytidylyltransferase